MTADTLRPGRSCWLWSVGEARWTPGWWVAAVITRDDGSTWATIAAPHCWPATVPTWRLATAEPTVPPTPPPGSPWIEPQPRTAR